jgi:tetratricopeptide (TPR) repeat protein
LSDEEQRALMHLSVFQDDFTREAAARVSGVSPRQLSSLLSALVDRAMLRTQPSGRYELHELLRRFAAGKLGATPGASHEAGAAHCRTYCAFLEEREASLTGANQREALDEIAAEVGNVRAAWQWAVEHALTEEIARGLESLYLFYYARGWMEEGKEVCRKALNSLAAAGAGQSTAHTLVVARLLSRLGQFTFRLGQHREARTLLRRSLVSLTGLVPESLVASCAGSRDCPLPVELRPACVERAFSLLSLGVVVRGGGEYKEAQRLCRRSFEIYRACANSAGMARSLKVLGILSGSLESYVEAQRQLQEALDLYQEVGDPYGIANTLNDMGLVAAGLDQNGSARRYYQDSLKIRRQIGDVWGIGASLNNLGYLAFLDKSYAEAKAYLQESLFIQREIGDPYHIAHCLNNLGGASSALGERYEAATYLHEALKTAFEIDATALVLEVLAAIGALLAKSEGCDPEQAAKLMAFVHYHPGTDHWTKERTAKALSKLSPDLPLDALNKAQEKGRAGELDTVVIEVLSHRDAWLATSSQSANVIVSSL